MAHRTGKEALAAAKRSIEPIAEMVQKYERMPGIREAAQLLIGLANDGRLPPSLHRYTHFNRAHPMFDEAMARTRDCAIFRLWARSKMVYAMDDSMLRYLIESRQSAIPTEVLRYLPHADPFVLLPQADFNQPDTAYFRTHIGVPWGAFVFGRYRDAQLLCSTRDEERQDFGLMFVGLLETDGRQVVQTVRCTVPLRNKLISVEDVVNATVSNFNFNEHLAESDRNQLEKWLRLYVTQVFNSLVYVCTDQPDITIYRPGINKAGKVKKSGRRQQRRPRSTDISEVALLGFHLGPALNEARQRSRGSQGPSSTGTGNRQPPNRRRGHYRTYWTGPGRRVPRLNWVNPYWVSKDLLGEDAPQAAVVRPVRRHS